MASPKLSDIKNFLQGYYNYYQAESLPEYITEQVQLRAYLCAPCLQNGKCTGCGCKTPHMFYSNTKVDSNGKWAEFLNEKQWKALKENIEEYGAYFNARKGEEEQLQAQISGSEQISTVAP